MLGPDSCVFILILDNHVLPNPLRSPGSISPSSQPALPYALPHRSRSVRVPHLSGPAESHKAAPANTLVQKPGSVLLQRALGAL